MCQRDEAVRVFEHFNGLGVKPNMTTYSLLLDAHLVVRDPKAALAIIDDMVIFILYVDIFPNEFPLAFINISSSEPGTVTL